MYGSQRSKKMCYTDPDKLWLNDFEDRIERDGSTGTNLKVRRFRDGTSTYDFGHCGRVNYDEDGNEC